MLATRGFFPFNLKLPIALPWRHYPAECETKKRINPSLSSHFDVDWLHDSR